MKGLFGYPGILQDYAGEPMANSPRTHDFASGSIVKRKSA
jgi:hypothetical protein